MKLSDAIKYSYIKTIRDKKNIYFIIIMTLCLFILIASLFFRIVYFSIVDDYTETAKDSRKLWVLSEKIDEYMKDKTFDLGYEKLLEIEHVVDTYDGRYDFRHIKSDTFKNEKYDGFVNLVYGSEASQPKYVNGEIIKDGDTDVAICSKNFYPNSEEKGLSNKDIEFINGNDLIGTTFKIEAQKYLQTEKGFVPDGIYKKEYRVIGTFDASETRDDLATCYISSKDIKELVDVTNINNYDEMVSWQIVLLDSHKNIDDTIENIKRRGFEVKRNDQGDNEMFITLKLICLFIITIVVVVIIFLSSLYIKKQNMKNKNDLAIMKSYGYEKKDIMKYSLCSLSWLMILSFIIGIILFFVALILLKNMFNNFLLENHIYIKFYISPYTTALIILMIITVITNYFTINKLSKRQTLSIIKE